MIHGRDDELKLISEVLDSRGAALVLRGPAGVGKSALLAHLPATVRVSGVESEVELAFSGLHQLVSPLLGHLGELPEVQAAALRCALGLATGETTDLAVCAATLELLRVAAEQEPLVIVVDDAHNLDRASTRTLLFAARRLQGSRVAMFFGVREGFADLPGITLAGLDVEAAARMLPELAPSTVAVLVEATGGNPLALRELEPDRALLDALVTGTVQVGDALREVFASRVAALPEPNREALLVAAAENTGHIATVLAACKALGLPDDALNAPGLITVGGGEVSFAHPLVRASVYAGATAARKRSVHNVLSTVDGEAGRRHRALATVGSDETLAAVLESDAVDTGARGGIGAAVSALHEAARLSGTPAARSRRLAAAAHAAWKSGHADLARALIARTTPDESTDRTLARLRGLIELYSGDKVTAFEQLSRASESLWDKAPEEAADLLLMACDAAIHAGQVPDAVAALRKVADSGPDLGYRNFGRWMLAAEIPAPWQVFDAAPAAIQRSGAHRWLVPMAISLRGPHLRQAREFAVAAVADLRERGMLAIHAVPLYWLAELEHRLGLWDEGIAHAEESLRAAKDSGQRPSEANAHALLALFAAGRGNAVECHSHARAALELAVPVRDRLAAARATWALGLLELGSGEYEAASQRLATLATPGLAQSHEYVARQALADAVEAHVRVGDLEQAESLTDESAYRCRALISEDADKLFELALSTEEYPFERARIALSHGQWLRRNRRTREARTLLRLAAELFEGLSAAPWSERARAELRACGGASTAPDSTLTPQELEVAKLAAAGLSNREIGERLFLSHRTVGYHLHKIFPKVGVARRAQLRAVPGLSSPAEEVDPFGLAVATLRGSDAPTHREEP